MIEEAPAPVVQRPVTAELVHRVVGHLVEARDDHVVALLRVPGIEIHLLAGDAIGDPVPEGVAEGVRHRPLVDVDRVDRLGAVQGELRRQQPGAAADVEAAPPLPDSVHEEVLPDQEAALGRDEHARLDQQLGHRQGVEGVLARVAPVLERPGVSPGGALGALAAVALERGRAGPGPRAREPGLGGGDVLRANAAAAADQLCPLLSPLRGELGVLGARDLAVERPARLGVVAEVGIDAERQVGEVAQPGEHPRDVVGRDAVDHQRSGAHLLEAAGRPAEEVALGASPVLAEHAAETVAASPEAEPDGEAAGDQRLHAAEGDVLDEGHGLQQDQVGRLLLEDAGEQLQALQPLFVGDIAMEAEGHGDLALTADVRHGLAGEPDPAAGELHPVPGRHPRQRALAVHRALDPPGVGGDHVAADLGVAAVDLPDGLGCVEQRPDPPHRVVAELVAGDLELLQLGGDPAVEDHALLCGEQSLHAAVGRRAVSLRAGSTRRGLRPGARRRGQ